MLNPMTPSVFYRLADAAGTTLASAHAIGSGTLVVADASAFGATSGLLRLTILRASDDARCHYSCSAISGNTLTVTPIDGYADLAFSVGDTVGVCASAETFQDIHAAISATQTALNSAFGGVNAAAPLASPAFTGNPTAPTPASGDDSAAISTTAWVKSLGYQTAAALAALGYQTASAVSSAISAAISALNLGTASTHAATDFLTPASILAGSNVVVSTSGGTVTIAATGVAGGGGGSTAPGGSTGQIQYNASGSFAGATATINTTNGGISSPKFYANATFDSVGGRNVVFSFVPADAFSHGLIAQAVPGGNFSFCQAFGVCDANYNPIAGLNFAGVFNGDGSGLTNLGGTGTNSTNLGPTRSITNGNWTSSYVLGVEICDLVSAGGSNLIAIGDNIWRQNGASNNIGFGNQVGAYAATNVGNNVAIGNTTLASMTAGGGNVAVGHGSGGASANLTNSLFLGMNATSTSATLTNCSAIGYGAVVSSNNTMVLGGTGGNNQAVVIGDTTAAGCQLLAVPASVGTVGIGVRALPGQTADLVSLLNSTGTPVSGLDQNGALRPPQVADSTALNGTLYYSTSAGKLAFKDLSGTVHTLY